MRPPLRKRRFAATPFSNSFGGDKNDSAESENLNDWDKAVTYLKEARSIIENWNADQEGRMSAEVRVGLVFNRLVEALTRSNHADEAIQVGEEVRERGTSQESQPNRI